KSDMNRFAPTALKTVLLLASLSFTAAVQAQQQAPELFTYAELVQLYETPNLPDALQVKLDRLLTTPFVSNVTSARVELPKTAGLGSFVRVVQWNIERGIEYDAIKAALTNATQFSKLIDSSAYPRGSRD